jgi:hypothetical protein
MIAVFVSAVSIAALVGLFAGLELGRRSQRRPASVPVVDMSDIEAARRRRGKR